MRGLRCLALKSFSRLNFVGAEPDLATTSLRNVSFVDCVADGNAGHQFQAWLGKFNASTEPVSITFDNCTANGRGLLPSFGTAPAGFFFGGFAPGLRGGISVVNSAAINTGGPGALIRRPTAAATFSVSFRDTLFENVARCTKAQHGCATDQYYENYFFNFDGAPLSMFMDPGKTDVIADGAVLGGLSWENCTVRDDRPRPFLLLNASWVGGETRRVANVWFDGTVEATHQESCHSSVDSGGADNVSTTPTVCSVTPPPTK